MIGIALNLFIKALGDSSSGGRGSWLTLIVGLVVWMKGTEKITTTKSSLVISSSLYFASTFGCMMTASRGTMCLPWHACSKTHVQMWEFDVYIISLGQSFWSDTIFENPCSTVPVHYFKSTTPPAPPPLSWLTEQNTNMNTCWIFFKMCPKSIQLI